MASPDRRRANRLYARARFFCACVPGFLVGTWIYPGPWPVPPSIMLAVWAATSAVLLVVIANYLWGRNDGKP
jgi:hypothetical protein